MSRYLPGVPSQPSLYPPHLPPLYPPHLPSLSTLLYTPPPPPTPPGQGAQHWPGVNWCSALICCHEECPGHNLGQKCGTKTNLLEIPNSSLFQSGEGREQIQKTFRYNVHKNLGECFMDESDIQKAEDAQITRTFVTLWFQLASASVMLGNFGNVRGA